MKKRRVFIKKMVGLGSLITFGSIPLFGMGKAKKINGRFVHMVFFWLKETTDADAFIRTTEAFLKQVDEINSYHIGKPAGTPREVVDNSYQISLVVTFDSKEDQNVYQDHEVHKQYVVDNSDKWNKVQIYDSWGEVFA